MPLVKCSVANCHYHGEENECLADAIMVDVGRHADLKFEQTIGENQVDSHIDYAMSKVDTLCHTFKAIN